MATTKRSGPHRRRALQMIAAGALGGSLLLAALASAASIGPVNFDGYATGDVNGQFGWKKTGPYDVAIENVADFADASGYGFGTRALRISNGYADGAFGGQAFAPNVSNEAGEAAADSGGVTLGPRQTRFEVSFKIGTTSAAEQPGLSVSMSPDRGNGDRISYLGFADMADGVHVTFYDVTNPGPLGTVSSFDPTEVAVLDRGHSHEIGLTVDFVDGPNNDVVKVYVDGVMVHQGGSWEDYYRYDPEQNGNGNLIPTTAGVIFAARGSSVVGVLGDGFLIDGLSYGTSTPEPEQPAGPMPGVCRNVVSGTNGADTLRGSRYGDRIVARRGADRLVGLAGHDCLLAGRGNDRLFGGTGRDRLFGGIGADRLFGGPGLDRLYGGPGVDRLFARDGRRDIVNCGGGRHDRAVVNRTDVVRGCETVFRSRR